MHKGSICLSPCMSVQKRWLPVISPGWGSGGGVRLFSILQRRCRLVEALTLCCGHVLTSPIGGHGGPASLSVGVMLGPVSAHARLFPRDLRRCGTAGLHTLLLLLSRFSRVQLCATPQTAAHQAPPPLGFFRQEHWSGLPFPSPVHESEKWKWSRSVVSHSSRPHGLQPTRLLCPWDFPGKRTGVGCHCLLRWPH